MECGVIQIQTITQFRIETFEYFIIVTLSINSYPNSNIQQKMKLGLPVKIF